MLASLSISVQATLPRVLAITHTMTSAAIGMHVQSVPFAFALAFLFHLFADTLLHWNIYLDKHRWPYFWVAMDVLGGLLAAYWLTPEQFFTGPMLAAVLGGNLPDLWAGGLDLRQKLRAKGRSGQSAPAMAKDAFYRFHEGIQNETLSPARGLAWQIVLLTVALVLL